MPMEIRDPRSLSKDALADIVSRLQVLMYGEDDSEGYLMWNEDKEVNGGDLVEMTARILAEFDLVPFLHGPREWAPAVKKRRGRIRPR